MTRLLVLALGLLLLLPAAAAAAPPRLLAPFRPVLHPTEPAVVYATGLATDQRTRVWRSADGGATFADISHGLPVPRGGGAIADLAVSAQAPGTLYVAIPGDRAVWRSRDDGASWQRLPTVGRVIDVEVGAGPGFTPFALVEPADGVVPAFDDACTLFDPEAQVGAAGLYRFDGAAWRRVLAIYVDRLNVHPTQPGVVYTGNDCAEMRTADGGRTWRAHVGTNRRDVVLDPADVDGALALGRDDARLERTTDGGRTWTRVPGVPTLTRLLQPVAAAPHRIVAVGTGDAGRVPLYVSDDFGASWRRLTGLAPRVVFALGVSPADPQRLYALGRAAMASSADGGATWSAFGRPLDGVGARVELASRDVALRPALGGRRPAHVHVAVAPDAAEQGYLVIGVRVVLPQQGRLRDAGQGVDAALAAPSRVVDVRLTARAARAVRRAGSLDGLAQIVSVDAIGEFRVRWLPITVRAAAPT